MKRLFTVLLVAALAVSMVACAAAEAAKKNPFADPIKIAWIPTNAPDANCTAWGRGIERELSYWPNVSFAMFDGERNSEKQSRVIYDLISQEYDAIILQAFNSAGVAPAVADAEQAGIPVVCVNIDASTPHAALVAMTDYEAGFTIAVEMAKSVDGKGSFVVIQATPGATRGENLEAGFHAGLKQYPDIKIIDSQTGEWLTERANAVMTDFLTKHPTIDGVFCHNDQMAQGAAMAAQAAGRLDQMVIWGANGENKAMEYIEQGLMTGTIYTNCYDQGSTAARLAMMFIGSDVDSSKFTSTPVMKMPPIAVTKENVATITPDMRW
jgi:ribose transport system substrate-binding protein